MDYEENIPAEHEAPQEKARVSNPDADEERAQDSQRQTEKGTKESLRLKNEGLPRVHRLRKRKEYREVYRIGGKAVGRYVVVFGLRRQQGGVRLGVTASKKVGNAVIRNRCRRRIREVFRLNRGRVAFAAIDLVVNARRDCALVPWAALERDYVRCLERLERNLRGRMADASSKGAETTR